MSYNKIGIIAEILFWVLLSISILYIFIKDIRQYAVLAELIISGIGFVFAILFVIGLIAVVLTLFRSPKPN